MPTPRSARLTGHRQLLHASTVTRPLLRGSVGHDEALHLRLVAPAPLADGRLQHADHHAVEAEHEGEQRRDRDQPEHVLVCGAERRGGAEVGAGAGARAASWGWWAGGAFLILRGSKGCAPCSPSLPPSCEDGGLFRGFARTAWPNKS